MERLSRLSDGKTVFLYCIKYVQRGSVGCSFFWFAELYYKFNDRWSICFYNCLKPRKAGAVDGYNAIYISGRGECSG